MVVFLKRATSTIKEKNLFFFFYFTFLEEKGKWDKLGLPLSLNDSII